MGVCCDPVPKPVVFSSTKECARVTGKAGANGQNSGVHGVKTVGSPVW